MMPVLDGLSVLKTMRQKELTRSALTAKDSRGSCPWADAERMIIW